MNAELALWRLGAGLLGGKWIVATGLGVAVCGYAALIYVIFNPLRDASGADAFVQMTAMMSAVIFLIVAFAPTALRSIWRDHTLLRLAPDAHRMTSALTRRLMVLALIASVPAVVLRALLWVRFGNSIEATISLADVTFKNYAFVMLYLAHVVVLTTITFGPLKVPPRFVFLPITYGTMHWSSVGYFWLPLTTCSVLVIVRFCWPTLTAWMGQKQHSARPTSERTKPHTSWRIAQLQKRADSAAVGPNGASLRVIALLASNTRTPLTIVTVVAVAAYLTVEPGFADSSVLSSLMAYPIALLLAQLSPLPLGRIMLLPLGVERARMGVIMTAVWVRQLNARVLLCVIIGLLVHALCWWLQWPAFARSPAFESVDLATQLLWSPLAQSVGLYGMALGICLLFSASPRLLATPSFLRVGSTAALIVLAVVAVAFNGALKQWIAATDARNMGHATFAIVNGMLLPGCAWCVNRALSYQWATADLSAISAAMHASSVRSQNTFSPQ